MNFFVVCLIFECQWTNATGIPKGLMFQQIVLH